MITAEEESSKTACNPLGNCSQSSATEAPVHESASLCARQPCGAGERVMSESVPFFFIQSTKVSAVSPCLFVQQPALVEPGFGGQSFMSEMMDKVSRTRELIGDRPIWLQVDGGISKETIEIASAAGADTFVAGSAVYKAQDPAAMVSILRDLAQSVQK